MFHHSVSWKIKVTDTWVLTGIILLEHIFLYSLKMSLSARDLTLNGKIFTIP